MANMWPATMHSLQQHDKSPQPGNGYSKGMASVPARLLLFNTALQLLASAASSPALNDLCSGALAIPFAAAKLASLTRTIKQQPTMLQLLN
jgi:hypothetical protein